MQSFKSMIAIGSTTNPPVCWNYSLLN